jgi:hypothetical protein
MMSAAGRQLETEASRLLPPDVGQIGNDDRSLIKVTRRVGARPRTLSLQAFDDFSER